ncbi:phosphopantetheine-binding protein [Luteococcus sp.]|uniref:phosphopantetheine-binding protein n=1 Tax=Luteococcus sp. TaxID=1969402 RepID=UPI0037354E44
MTIMTEQARNLILEHCRENDLPMTEVDLDRPLVDLDLDSLDRLEIIQMLEREFQVKADKQEVMALETLNGFVSYFAALTR